MAKIIIKSEAAATVTIPVYLVGADVESSLSDVVATVDGVECEVSVDDNIVEVAIPAQEAGEHRLRLYATYNSEESVIDYELQAKTSGSDNVTAPPAYITVTPAGGGGGGGDDVAKQGTNPDATLTETQAQATSAAADAAAAKTAAQAIVIPTDYAKQGTDATATLTATQAAAVAAKTAAETLTGLDSDITAGKTAIATAIAGKGVQSSASDTLMQMAFEVQSISQQPITLQGAALYEEQMCGAPTDMETAYQQPDSPLWNLYKIMVDLLNDARFVSAGGIMLAEYFKGYSTIELKGLGPGGQYLTCDGHLYNINKEGADAHVWEDKNNGKCNRWVAYIFAGENEGYTIPSTSLCPRSIHIGRRVGTIACTVAGRIREIVVTDGTDQNPNRLAGTNFTSTQVWQQEVTLRNMTHSAGYLFNNAGVVVSVVLENMTITKPIFFNSNNSFGISALYIKRSCTMSLSTWSEYTPKIKERGLVYIDSSPTYYLYIPYVYIEEGTTWTGACLIDGTCNNNSSGKGSVVIDGIKNLSSRIFGVNNQGRALFYTGIYADTVERITNYPFLSTVDGGYEPALNWLKVLSLKSLKSGSLGLTGNATTPVLEDVVVGAMEANLYCGAWNPTSIISDATKVALINSNIRDHIAANVADGNNTLTFTVSTNLYNNLEQATLDAFAAKHWLVAGA